MAFDYVLGNHGDDFGPIFETSDGRRHPPDLKDIPSETWNWWLAAQPDRYPGRWLVPGSTTCASPEAEATEARLRGWPLSLICKRRRCSRRRTDP